MENDSLEPNPLAHLHALLASEIASNQTTQSSIASVKLLLAMGIKALMEFSLILAFHPFN
jgi:hypothetical protein